MRPASLFRPALLLALLLATSAHAAPDQAGAPPASVTARHHGDAERPAEASGWVRSELYFGVGAQANQTEDQPVIGEAQWRQFLDTEVTPRFPDGLTVFDAYGQWLFRGREEPNRLPSKVLVILHENTASHRNNIEAIRLAWKQVTGHQSVLWASTPVEVSF